MSGPTSSEGPSRPLEIAIRDYSPGSEVVIDGLVHRSDGILPTWGNRKDPGSVEDLRTLWACRSCGAFGVSRLSVTACTQCGEAVRPQEMLRPSGFLGTRTPHSAYEALDYVPPDRPRVSAEAGAWVALPDPGTGRSRATSEGAVLTTASGPNGNGYAICIACGRAESEKEGEDPDLPRPMVNHFPLQKLRDNLRHDGCCPGNDLARKIRRLVRLGTELTTDVFELQLEALAATGDGQRQAFAIGASLREALAARLGVDAEAMGVAVAPSRRADGARRHLIFLFDRGSGSSGFAVTAESDLPRLLHEAARRLDCPAGCSNGCPECVLRRDVQFDQARLDRKGALAVLRERVLPH